MMDGAKVFRLRSFLGYTQPECAALIGGCSLEAWQAIEASSKPAPQEVQDRLLHLIAQYQGIIKQHARTYQHALAEQTKMGIKGKIKVKLLDYLTADDFVSIQEFEEVYFRPHQRATQALDAFYAGPDSMIDLRIINFDPRAYSSWLKTNELTHTRDTVSRWTFGLPD
jgi:hypothetical protein